MSYKFYKDGSLQRPRNVSKAAFASASYGQEFEIYQPLDYPLRAYHFSSSDTFNSYTSEDYKKIKALKNTINYYSGIDESISYDNIYNKPLCLLAFNMLHVGNGFEKGSINLKYYFQGNLLDSASDPKQNGVLYNKNNNKVGFVLYKEGFIFLTYTGSLSTATTTSITGSAYSSSTEYPKWVYYFTNDNPNLAEFIPEYSTKDQVATSLTFATAEKNLLNHSNNSTYLESGSYFVSTSSYRFVENNKIAIKNTVPSPFVSGSANFEKQTFITRIGLFDKDKKLIGVASLANPVRKTENREFLFKIKIDI